uniref:tripartite motif-containing protein 60-like isoform X2 n=1 Tax=Myxine glutinosa TaxID=7769 RepID=UPI00358EA640
MRGKHQTSDKRSRIFKASHLAPEKMATSRALVDGEDFCTCIVCMELFREPVTLGCGHSFCRECVEKYWKNRGGTDAFSCPSCREVFPQRPHLRKNVILGNLLAQMNLRENINEARCTKHAKLIELYCKDDESLMCTMCMSGGHRQHNVVVVEIAHAELKEGLTGKAHCLAEMLQNTRSSIYERMEKIKNVQCSGVESEKMLERKQKELYRAVDEVVGLLKKRINERQGEELSCLEQHKLKLQLECMALQKAESTLHGTLKELKSITFLQGYKDLHHRMQAVSYLPCVDAPSNIVLDFSEEEQKLDSLIQVINNVLKENESLPLPKEVPANRQTILDPSTLKSLYSWTPSLDLNSVEKSIVISKDRKMVTQTRTQQPYPDHADRFDFYPQVLSSDSFSSGRYYWEVDVSLSRWCVIGLALNSMERKGRGNECVLGRNPKSWCVWKCSNKYSACHNDKWTSLTVPVKVDKLGFFLDCEAGELTCFGDSKVLHVFRGNFTDSVKPALGIGYCFGYLFGYWFGGVNDSVRFCR